MVKKAWKLREAPAGATTLLDLLLWARGLGDPTEAEAFLAPDYERQIHDPFLLRDMDRAVERVGQAIAENQKVVIFADYDADGVPAGALLSIFFTKIGFANFEVYIPDRHEEAYGLSLEAVEKLAAAGAQLILTVDCGIANEAEIARAKELGVEVVVTDHHLVPETGIPSSAVAVVNPKRLDDEYPCKHLCGTGVAFKLVQALLRGPRAGEIFQVLEKNHPVGREKLSSGPRKQSPDHSESFSRPLAAGWEKWLLDLVAIATVSDMVPLVGENRTLVRYGLIVLRKSPRAGIHALCRVLKLKQENIVEDDIAFLLGPRINAASRMSHGLQAYQLLTTNNPAEALALAEQLESQNKDRKSFVDAIVDSLEAEYQTNEAPPVIVAGDPGWSLGVLGLAASRVVEKFNRPVFLWGKNGSGLVKGSCRSDGSVNVVELMRSAGEDLFVNLGGHQFAGGFSLLEEKVDQLAARIIAAYQTAAKVEVLEELLLDAELSIDDVHEATHAMIERLSPFGMENPKPLFLFRAVPIAARKLMRGGLHVELTFTSKYGNVSAMSFFNSYPELKLRPGDVVDVAATIEKSYFRRFPELRLRIVDLRRTT